MASTFQLTNTGTSTNPQFVIDPSQYPIPAGSTITVTFSAQSSSDPATVGTTLINTMNATTGGTTNPPPATDSGVYVQAPNFAGATKIPTDGNGNTVSTVLPGSTITYVITATNSGPIAAYPFYVQDTVSDAASELPYYNPAVPPVVTINGVAVPASNIVISPATSTSSTPLFTINQTVPSGATVVVSYPVTVPASTPAGTVVNNTATLKGYATDPGTTVPSPTVTVLPTDLTNNTFTKSANVSQIGPGQSYIYTLRFTANTIINTNLTLSDPLPAYVYMPAGSSGSLINSATGTTATIGNSGTTSTPAFTITGPIASGTTLTLSFPVTVDPTAPVTTNLINTGMANDGGANFPTSNSPTVTVVGPKFTGATKTTTNLTPTPTSSVPFTLTATNNGNGPASSLIFTDNFPVPALTYDQTVTPTATITNGSTTTNASVSVTAGTNGAQIFTVTGPIPVGATVALHFNGIVSASAPIGSTITNSGRITAYPGDPGTAVTDSVTVSKPDFTGATKTSSPSQVLPGGLITYTITATNHGLGTASPFTITDTLPATVSLAGNATATVNGTATTVTTNSSNPQVPAFTTAAAVAPGDQVVLTFQVRVGNQVAAGTILPNSALLTGYPGDPGTTINDANPPVVLPTDLTSDSFSKTATPSMITPGAPITYTLSFTTNAYINHPLTITDTLPTYVTFPVGAVATVTGLTSTSSVANAGTNTVPIFTLPSGTPANTTFTLTFTANSDPYTPVGQVLTNTSNINDGSASGGLTTKDSGVTVAAPNFTTSTKTADKTTVLPGSTITYTIAATNNGPISSNPLAITDALPTGLLYNPSSGVNVTINGNQATNVAITSTDSTHANFTIYDNVPPGATVLIQFTVSVATNLAAGTSIQNSANIGGYPTDPTVTIVDSTGVNVLPSDITKDSIVKNASTTTVMPGGTYTYTLTYSSVNGVNTDLNISDNLPPYVILDGPITMNYNGTISTPANVGTNTSPSVIVPGLVPAGAVITLSLPVAVAATAPVATPLNNTATMSDSTQLIPSNTNTVTVVGPNFANSTKTTTSTNPLAGSSIPYTITSTNSGNAAADSYTFVDQFPTAGVTYDSSVTPSATINGINAPVTATPNSDGTVTFVVTGSVPVGATVLLHFNAIVNATLPLGATVTNSGRITGFTGDPGVTVNNTTPIVSAPNFSDAVKTVSPSEVTPGQVLTYTITATNTGAGVANPLVIRDSLPTGLTLTGATTGTINGANVNILVSGTSAAPDFTVSQPVLPGDTVIITYTAVVPYTIAAGTRLQNSAALYGYTGDPGTTVTDPGAIVLPTDISSDQLAKTASPTAITPGETITYTVTYVATHDINSPLTLTDMLPEGVTLPPGAVVDVTIN